MSPFKDRVIEIITKIPYGKVVSYGQVALYVGLPRAARQVGWVLNQSEGRINIPWWRVINREGIITIAGTKYNDKMLQKKLLEAEGIEVNEDLKVDMAKYRFVPDEKFLREAQLSGKYLQTVIEKYSISN